MKYKVTLSIGFHGAEHNDILDVCDEEIADCETDEELQRLLDDYWKDWAWNYIDGSILKDEDTDQ